MANVVLLQNGTDKPLLQDGTSLVLLQAQDAVTATLTQIEGTRFTWRGNWRGMPKGSR